ncbi:uncharacterized protein LOC111343766 [Stylophora pistillata]|uniref:uncharacterized protein LOC111343766 n=1 Tax=Stylophora pistillata TaxID=50429 RepID=UPI000C051486|nr:uncharacterized protein LOC111343766 [Stylophora pistillata]XP_022806687.1 uncharacterized protein LOC111343766 [Stylophora pistillata]XP_022806688.1 uncharacterized protein LOC111343766 [Stylophora pistillata]XP_022806689.1 uncharacterized protein LOC111343766 [Stylophora pistillata]
MKTLAARKLGLVFKEASAKKINPQHEYHFFHKTFQEYLAALYLAKKLLEEKINVYRDLKLSFHLITSRYKQVFIFVSGILGEATCNLFRQIGENLENECWNWLGCEKEEATFFTECFRESGKEEQLAMTLCSFIPFSQSITVDVIVDEVSCEGVLSVVKACKSFSQLQLPVHFTYKSRPLAEDSRFVYKFLASYSRLETFSISVPRVTEDVTSLVCKVLQLNSSLHSFTFETMVPIPSEEAVVIGDSLAANKTLQTVTLKLLGGLVDDWVTVLEKGLSGDTPLTSVVLEISGSVRESGKNALKNLLSNRSLKSLSFAVYGDMHDSLATLVGEGLAADPCLQSLTLIVYGSVSCSAFTSLKKGVVENNALKSLELKVFGGLPDNWVNICEALYAAKKSSSMSLTIKPDVVSKITNAQVACLRPVLKERVGAFKLHSFTVNMWGELSCSGASDLCKLLIASTVSCVNLNIHGRVTDSVATCLAENFEKVNSCTLSDLSINIRGELTRDGNSILQSLECNQTFAFTLNVQDVNVLDKSCDEVKLYGVDSSSLKEAFTKFESICSRVSKLILNLNNPSNSSEVDWGCSVGDVLAKFVSLATLSLSFNNYRGWDEDWLGHLWSGVAQNTSITTLSITVNSYNEKDIGLWMYGLWESLNQNTSITTLSITLNFYSKMEGDRKNELYCGLKENTSVTALSITENIYCDVYKDYNVFLCGGLEVNTSLTTLSIVVNNYKKIGRLCLFGPLRGLEENTSITTLNISLNNCGEMSGYSVVDPFDFLSVNPSLVTLSLALNYHSNSYEDYKDWIHKLHEFSQALEMKNSPIRICFEVNVFSERNEKT